MLILSRKIQETIMIGDDIEVCVLSFDGIKVRLGVRAPRNIPVHRREIYLRIQSEKIRLINDHKYQPKTIKLFECENGYHYD